MTRIDAEASKTNPKLGLIEGLPFKVANHEIKVSAETITQGGDTSKINQPLINFIV